MLYDFQDPKYQIEVVSVQKQGAPEGTTHTIARLVNRASGKPIPDDEPVFILRGQDRLAEHAIESYCELCVGSADETGRAAYSRMEEFTEFAQRHPERMKTPD